MTCFYHKSDLDGMCSGAIVKMLDQAVELRGIQYGEPFPFDDITPGQTVYMVDFSLQPFSDMDRLNKLANLVWIDHHKTSLDEAQQVGFLASGGQSLAIGTAGCELTWGFCFPDVAMPASVFMLGRYDVWDHMNHPGSLEFQYGVRQYDTRPENQDFWQELFMSQGLTERIKQEGSLLLSYEEKQNAAYCRSCAFEVEVDGLRCIAINRGLTNSLIFKAIYDPERHDAMMSFCMMKNGKWTVNLYSDKPDVDVSITAKARGGGGHKGAAGFQCESLSFGRCSYEPQA